MEDEKSRGDRLNDRLAEDLHARRPGALEEVLARFGQQIQAVAFLILHNQSDAEEMVVETMVTAWRRAETLRESAALRNWLLRIATRHALSRRRRPSVPTTPLLASVDRSVGDLPSIDGSMGSPRMERRAEWCRRDFNRPPATTRSPSGLGRNRSEVESRAGVAHTLAIAS